MARVMGEGQPQQPLARTTATLWEHRHARQIGNAGNSAATRLAILHVISLASSLWPTPAVGYLLRDRDEIFGPYFEKRVASMGIEEDPTAPQSPWQNPYCER